MRQSIHHIGFKYKRAQVTSDSRVVNEFTMSHFRFATTEILFLFWILWNYKAVRGEEEDEMAIPTAVTPNFVSTGEEIRVIVGDTIRLQCQVDNLGPYVLLWKRGPSVLSAGEMKITRDKRISLVNGFDLQIQNVRLQDAGEYVCQLSTYTPKEQVHSLEILVPPSVTSEPAHVVVSKGDKVTLQCNGTGNPVPTITWTRRNNMLPNGEQSSTGNLLSLQLTERYYGGIYVCTGDNGVGTPVNTQVNVKVQYPPEVEVERAWIHTTENQEAVLACVVHSDPPAYKVKWYRDTMILDTDGRRLMEERGSRHSLIIRKVQRSDFGNYSCEANNKLGRSTKYIELSGKPNRAIFRSDPIGRMRDSFNITWTVESLTVVDQYRLSYRKKHVNETHDDLPGPWLDVVLPAVSTEKLRSHERTVANKGTSAGASSTTRDNSVSIIHWKAYRIRNLDPGVTYQVKVSARNKYGWGHSSDIFQFNTRSSEPEVRDMRITSPTSLAGSVHSSHLLITCLSLVVITMMIAADGEFFSTSPTPSIQKVNYSVSLSPLLSNSTTCYIPHASNHVSLNVTIPPSSFRSKTSYCSNTVSNCHYNL